MKHIKKFNENISNANKFLSKDDIYEINDMLLDLKDEGFFYDVEYYVDNSDVLTRDSGDWVDSGKTDIELNNICSMSISFIASNQYSNYEKRKKIEETKLDNYWELVSNTLNRIIGYVTPIYNINIHHTKGIDFSRHSTNNINKALELAKNSSKGLIDICIFCKK